MDRVPPLRLSPQKTGNLTTRSPGIMTLLTVPCLHLFAPSRLSSGVRVSTVNTCNAPNIFDLNTTHLPSGVIVTFGWLSLRPISITMPLTHAAASVYRMKQRTLNTKIKLEIISRFGASRRQNYVVKSWRQMLPFQAYNRFQHYEKNHRSSSLFETSRNAGARAAAGFACCGSSDDGWSRRADDCADAGIDGWRPQPKQHEWQDLETASVGDITNELA